MNDTGFSPRPLWPDRETPFDRAAAEFEYHRRQFEQEQQDALNGEDHLAELRLIMWLAGRADPPTG